MQRLTVTHPPVSSAPRRRRVLGVVLSAAVGMGWFAARAAAQQFTEQPAADTSWYSPLLVGAAATLGFLLQLLVYVVGHLTIVLTKIFIWSVTYSDYIYNGTVTVGWEIVRDFGNMFFVVAILAIAWATILQIEAYGYRRLLPKLVLMAVLINFSKLITGVIIDLGQIVILTFAQASVGGLDAQQLFVKLGVGDLTSFASGKISESDLGGQAFSLLGTLLFGFILLVIIFGVILAYTVIFTFRIVALWILIILSPLAFLLAAFPAGQSYSRQWWSSLSKYVTTGAVIMFFFWLALVTSERAFSIISPELMSQQGTSSLGVAGSTMGEPINLSRFIITVSFLIAGLVAAQKAGVAGSDFAGSVLQRMRRAPGQLAKLAYRSSRDTYAWGARKVAAGKFSIGIPFTKWQWTPKTGGPDLNVMNWVRGFKESRAEKKIQEEKIGRMYAGEAMHRGGFRGTFRGLGAGRDFFDAYAKGFLNVEGFKRMGGALVGGEKSTGKLFKKVEHEQNQEKLLRQQAEEKKALANRKDFFEEGVEQYVEDSLEQRTTDVGAERAKDPNIDQRYRKEYLTKAGVDKEESERLAKLALTDPESIVHFGTKEYKDFETEKDKDVALKRVRAEAENMKKGSIRDQSILNAKGRARFALQRDQADNELSRIRAGDLVGDALVEKQKGIDKLEDELKRIEAAIKAADTRGQAHPELDTKKVMVEAELGAGANYNHAKKKWEANAALVSPEQRAANIDKYAKFDVKQGETIRDSMVGKAQARVDNLNAHLRTGATAITEDQRERLRAEAKVLVAQADESKGRQAKLKDEAGRKEAPTAFYAGEGYQGLIREQMGKIHAQNADELLAALKSAQRDGDKIKFAAIMQKMARDSNDNEIWSGYGFNSDAQGKHDFFNAVLMGHKGVKLGDGTEYTGPSLNMSEQEALSLENSIDYINEDVGHWETARTIKMEGGLFKRMDEEEHALAALAEIMKKNPREVARGLNRLAYGGERITNRATGEREFMGPSALGKGIMLAMGAEIAGQFNRGEYNKNAVVNIGKWIQNSSASEELRKYGIDDRYISRLDNIYKLEQIRGTTGAADTIRQLFKQMM